MKAFYHDKMEREKQSIMKLLHPVGHSNKQNTAGHQMGKRGKRI